MQRGKSLLYRYGLGPERAISQIKDCVTVLTDLGCAPTFPTPGILVEHYPQFIRSLQEAGVRDRCARLPPHQPNDLPVAEAVRQILRAARSFERFGIEARRLPLPLYVGAVRNC